MREGEENDHSATVVLKTRRPNIYCGDARFCRHQEQTCGQQRERGRRREKDGGGGGKRWKRERGRERRETWKGGGQR